MAFLWQGRQRWRLVFLLMCCNAVLYINRANMSIAVTFMYGPEETIQRARVLASFYCGYPLSQITAGHLAGRFGGKRVLLTAAVVWSCATLLIVPAYHMGPWTVCVARALVGLAEGANYPAIMALLSAWIPPEERSQAFSFLAAGESVGTVAAMLGCTFLAQLAGWQAVFVASAVSGACWCLAFAALAATAPEAHAGITAEELARIRGALTCAGEEARGLAAAVPWRRLLSSVALWAIIVPHFCFNWGYYLCLSVLPDYYQTNFHASYDELGILSLFPYLVLILVENSAGWIADQVFLERWSWPLLFVRKLCTFIALVGTSIFFFLLRTVPPCAPNQSDCWSIRLAAIYVTCAVGIGGVAFSGFQVNFLDISPRYSPHLMGISNTLASIPGVLGTMSLAWFGGDFASVFTFAAFVQLVGAAWYVAFARAEDQLFHLPQALGGCALVEQGAR